MVYRMEYISMTYKSNIKSNFNICKELHIPIKHQVEIFFKLCFQFIIKWNIIYNLNFCLPDTFNFHCLTSNSFFSCLHCDVHYFVVEMWRARLKIGSMYMNCRHIYIVFKNITISNLMVDGCPFLTYCFVNSINAFG